MTKNIDNEINNIYDLMAFSYKKLYEDINKSINLYTYLLFRFFKNIHRP